MKPPPLLATHRRPHHARWAWLAVPLLLFVGALVFYSIDEKVPDVSDLAFEPLALSETENAYIQLTLAAERAAQLLPIGPEESEALYDFTSGEKWDEAQITTWFTALSDIWSLYEQASKLPYSQGPIAYSPDDAFPEVGQIRRLSQLHLLRARQALRHDDPRSTIAHALISLEAGMRIAESRSVLIVYLTGIAIRSSALPVLADAARHPDCPPGAHARDRGPT